MISLGIRSIASNELMKIIRATYKNPWDTAPGDSMTD